MKTKICTACGEEYPATLEYWHRLKHGKFGLRSICKICSCKKSSEYKKSPKGKERNRINAAEWRKNNPEKTKKMNHNSYEKHKDRINENRREKYKTDPIYKAKQIEIERKYKDSGRRYEMNSKPEQREKAKLRLKKRRSIPEKKEHDYKRNEKWRKENKEYLIKCSTEKRNNLAPSYVAQVMKKKTSELTPETIETKRLIIKLRRELKDK